MKVNESQKDQHVAYLKGLTGYMQEWYPTTSLDEVLLAYQIGALGEYDIAMYATLSPVLIGEVMTAYKAFRQVELDRNPTSITDTSKLLAAPAEISEQDKELIARYYLHVAYRATQLGQVYEDLGNALYDFLDGKGLIPFTPERKRQFMMEAQEVVRKQHSAAGFRGSEAGRTLANLLKQAINEGKIHLPQKQKIIIQAKHIAFTHLLKELIEQQISVDDYLLTPIGRENNLAENSNINIT